ncbi:MAG: branched-chain amino acid ABC transporter permease [Thermodesulfobacteriota bacterium]
MLDFIQSLVNGIAAGSAYALMGLALTLIYKTSEVVNFAQGEMALVSVFMTYLVLDTYGFPFYLAFPAALVFSFLLGMAMEFFVLRRAKNHTVLSMIIITIGMEMILLGFVSWKFGADPKTMPFPLTPYDAFIVGNIFITKLETLTLFCALFLMAALFSFLRFSRFGLAMKAVQQNPTVARLMGIRVKRVLLFTWGASSLTGCVAGLLISPIVMQPYMMWDPMLKGFSAAVLGGMTSLPGAVTGAYLVGVIENIFGSYVSIEFKSVVAFAIIVLVLCIKPSGLFARHHVKKV